MSEACSAKVFCDVFSVTVVDPLVLGLVSYNAKLHGTTVFVPQNYKARGSLIPIPPSRVVIANEIFALAKLCIVISTRKGRSPLQSPWSPTKAISC